MATRGSKKQRSLDQEQYIAKAYGGQVTWNSGATIYQKGDVMTLHDLIECKFTGEPGSPKKSISLRVADLEKIASEARTIDRRPMMALQIHAPDSVLADRHGNIQLAVRLVSEDADRMWMLFES